MRIAIRVPEKASVLKWCREVGDVLVEIETDKTVVEVEAPAAGTLVEIVAEAGAASVEPDQAIGWIDDASAGQRPGGAGVVIASGALGQEARAPLASATAATLAPAPAGVPTASAGGRRFASPLARRIAAQHGLDLAIVAGTGGNGRVTARDVDRHLDGTARESRRAVAGPRVRDELARDSYDPIPITPMRAAIARRLTAAAAVPQFHVAVDVDVSALRELRARLVAAPPPGGAGPSLNDLFVKAVGCALARCPRANAIWADDCILKLRDVDVGVAVALDDGLVAPVLRKVDTLPLAAVSAGIGALVAAARARRLARADLAGGACGVSNLGMHGVDRFTAMLDPPRATMFAVGAVRQAVVVRQGAPAVAWVATLTLTCDHRVVDGALAATLLRACKELLEQPQPWAH